MKSIIGSLRTIIIVALVANSGLFCPAAQGAISMVSSGILPSAGAPANGYSSSKGRSLSADGTKIAFVSQATNLVSGDTNGKYDVFVRDLVSGVTTRVNVDSNGTQANNGDFYSGPTLSTDGKKVAFMSAATNLVSGDTNGAIDAFVHDLTTGITTRVSLSSNGTQGNGGTYFPSLNADGTKVAFYSDASNLVSNDTNACQDVFVRDLTTGITTRASVSSSGVQGDKLSELPSLSDDGTKVAFDSVATNLVSDDTNSQDVFVHDLTTGVTTRVSVDSSGTQANSFSYEGIISSDGTKVAFNSAASNLVSGDTNTCSDVFMHDLTTGVTTRVSMSSSGVQGSNNSYSPSLSADGTRVAFYSFANNLVNGDTNATDDVFVRDLTTGITTRISVNSSGVQGNYTSNLPSLSSDGKKVAFTSGATNLVSGDTNFVNDVFVSDMAPPPPTLSVSDPRSIPEGSSSTPGATTFNVMLTLPSSQTVSVAYQTTDNTAQAGSDYNAKSGTLTFAPGETIKKVTVNFVGDSIAELNDTFFLDLKTPTNAAIADSRGVAYIRNDDGPSLVIANAVTINEGNSDTSVQTFTVTLSTASANTVTVNYATANGTAGPADYTGTSGTLTFAPGETSKVITILVKGDTTVEPTETYRVNLSNPIYAVLADSQGVGYIRNDDAVSLLLKETAPSE